MLLFSYCYLRSLSDISLYYYLLHSLAYLSYGWLGFYIIKHMTSWLKLKNVLFNENNFQKRAFLTNWVSVHAIESREMVEQGEISLLKLRKKNNENENDQISLGYWKSNFSESLSLCQSIVVWIISLALRFNRFQVSNRYEEPLLYFLIFNLNFPWIEPSSQCQR